MSARLERYQLHGVEHLWQHRRAGLFYEMGLGKTLVSLAALTPENLPALVVAPKRVASLTWPEEAAKFRPDLSLSLAVGPPARRREALTAGADITVTGQETMSGALGAGMPRWRTLILDELSGYKDRGTARHRSARGLARRATYLWGLTGTPMPISPADLWAQLLLIDGGERLGRSLTAFRERYQRPGPRLPSGIITRWDMRPGATEEIIERISDICLSQTAASVLGLPPLIEHVEPVEMPRTTRVAYRAMARELVAELPSGEWIAAASAAVMAGKLGQLAAGFAYQDRPGQDRTTHRLDAAKLDAFEESWAAAGRPPALVFYEYVAELSAMLQRYPGCRQVKDPGALAAWRRGEFPLLLAHPKSAAHGLNLQDVAHHVYWLTLPWSPELYTQANARLHRRGQQERVIVHRLQASGSIDGVKAARLAQRGSAQDALMAHLRSVA